MLLNKFLVANLTIGLTVLLQGLVPLGSISKFSGVWLFSTATTCLVLAVVYFIFLLFLGRSKCATSMEKMKRLIYHSPAAVFSLLTFIFFIIYAFTAEASYDHPAIQNAIILLVVGSSILVVSSLVILFLAYNSSNNDDDGDRNGDRDRDDDR